MSEVKDPKVQDEKTSETTQIVSDPLAKIVFDSSKFTAEKTAGSESSVTIKYIDENAYIDMSPFSKSELKAHEAYRTTFNESAATACVAFAQDYMKKNTDISTAEFQIKNGAGGNRFLDLHIKREVVYNNNFGGENESVKTSRIAIGVTEPGVFSKNSIREMQKEFYKAINN